MISDREFMDAAAKGFPLEPRPWSGLAQELGLSEEEAIAIVRRLIAEGKVRRFAASVRHQPLGYAYNAMVIARTEERDLVRVGEAAAKLHAVSHCYQRPHPDGDPFCVYIMVHGREKETIENAVAQLRKIPGVRGLEVCASLRELKKTSVSGVSADGERNHD